MPVDSIMTAGDGVKGSVEPLSKEWAEKALRELNESPETIEESLTTLRTLLAGQ